MHAAMQLAYHTTLFEAQITAEHQKRCKTPASDQISAELIQAGGNTLRSEIHKLVNSVANKK
jgi:hypothetical protein